MSDESADGYDARADEWVVVRNCGYMHEAELIVAVLDAEGIDAFIPDAQMAGGIGLTVLIQGVRVLVRASDLEEANETLLVWDDAAISDGEEDFGDDDLAESGKPVDEAAAKATVEAERDRWITIGGAVVAAVLGLLVLGAC
jgi:hypothetical protein